MEIVKVEVTQAKRERNQRRTPDTKIYFFPENENVLQNLVDRHVRPYTEYRKLLPQVFKEAGLPVLKASWSQYCGCTCPCSPGFTVKGDIGKTIYVTVG